MLSLNDLIPGTKVRIISCNNKENAHIFLNRVVVVAPMPPTLDRDFVSNDALVLLDDSVSWPRRTVFWPIGSLELVPQGTPLGKQAAPIHLELDLD